MTQNQSVSVLIPAYNAETTIAAALDSVRTQTHAPLEIIIVDDASADGTLAAVRQYQSQHPSLPLVVIEKNENRGPAHSRNIGIRQARGCYVTLLDSDDYFAPDKIKKQVVFLESHPEYMGCGTFLQCFGQQQNIVQAETRTERLRDILLIGMPFLHSSFMFRREFVLKYALFYNEDYRTAEDYEWAIRLLDANAKITTIPEPLYYYRISGMQESFSKDKKNKIIRNEAQWQVAKQLHYKIWKRFLPLNHNLNNIEYCEIFLRHRTLSDSSEVKAYRNWFLKIKEYNEPISFFSPSFLQENFDYTIGSYILGQSHFSLQLMRDYLTFSRHVHFPSAAAMMKFLLKCMIGFKY